LIVTLSAVYCVWASGDEEDDTAERRQHLSIQLCCKSTCKTPPDMQPPD